MKYLNRIFSWMGSDGMSHVILSALIASVLSLVLPWWAAGIITLMVGVAKEIYDERTGKVCAEWKDLAYDIVGILIGVL